MKKGSAKPASGSIAQGWKKALRNEIEGREFYRMAAANARLDGVRQMFTFLMEEEERHRGAILEQFAALRKKGKGDAAAEKVFDDLIAWEREHLEILTRQYEQLREMFWEEARFWPFWGEYFV